MLRSIVLAVLALACSGCALVGSDAPLFQPGGALVLRPGVWSVPNGPCEFDAAKPVAAWPSCANAMVVSAASITGGFAGEDKTRQTIAYVLADGDPAVLQLQSQQERKPGEPVYVYAAARPLRKDPSGRVVEAKVWLALCYRPPVNLDGKGPAGRPDRPQRPFPGLVMKPGDSFCRASTPAAVRNAALRSEGVTLAPDAPGLVASWRRDGAR